MNKNSKTFKKQKPISKKTFKQSKKQIPSQQQQILSGESQNDQEKEFMEKDEIYQKYETVQETKNRLSKEILKGLDKKQKKQKIDNDFFIVEEEELKNNQQEDYDEQVAEQLKVNYMRKQNKLYEDLTEQYQKCQISAPTEYKGHTKCITAFQLTSDKIFSCSKDKSIIKWDRETGKKEFISLGKDPSHHKTDILCLTLHSNQNVVATAGEDCMIKMWDTRNNQLIETFKGHKNHINGIKFGINSNNLCSASSDLTFKHWDFAQRGLIETFYQHNAQVLDIDCFNGVDFLTSGNDHQIINWKTEKQTKIIYKGHEYAIDRVRTINHEKFVSCCQDGSINLWSTRKNRPFFKLNSGHKGWISALDTLKQSNIFCTGAIDRRLKLWAIEGDMKGLNLLKEIGMNGIVTDIKMRQNQIAATQCDELRLGRWVTDKCRNKIKVFRIAGLDLKQ